MKKILLFALPLLTFISCGRKDDDPTPTPTPQPAGAKVMYVHACVSAGLLKVSVNDTLLTTITGLDYLANSGYVAVKPGASQKSTFVIQNSNVPLASTTANLALNNNYSIFATGIVTNPSSLVVFDDLTAPAAGTAKIRFINLSPDTLNETVYVDNNTIDSNVVYKESTNFIQVNAGTYNIIAQDPKKVPQSKTLSNQQLTAGKIYTLILRGTANGSGNATLDLTLITNN
jgi:hypothetical protein